MIYLYPKVAWYSYILGKLTVVIKPSVNDTYLKCQSKWKKVYRINVTTGLVHAVERRKNQGIQFANFRTGTGMACRSDIR